MCPEILATQADTMSGESPSRRQGATSISNQAVTSLGRLISERRLPASESSDRALGLDASSSMSPRRGSMTGCMDLKPPPATSGCRNACRVARRALTSRPQNAVDVAIIRALKSQEKIGFVLQNNRFKSTLDILH